MVNIAMYATTQLLRDMPSLLPSIIYRLLLSILPSINSHCNMTVILGSLSHHHSMFSLRSDLSMRLQRWGNWIAYHDTTSNIGTSDIGPNSGTQSQSNERRVFWYNHETGHTFSMYVYAAKYYCNCLHGLHDLLRLLLNQAKISSLCR